eukprot:TRINITY_DN23869_c0_g1_i1.p1 TRINITY_DN23869_c0_g1~~TRINITY_DN23869_c0_g1_i1.p1  ORF type:complete len:1069 (-),score=137.20 TRINITY_DN23869_c0_g1_i1:16-3222(-)
MGFAVLRTSAALYTLEEEITCIGRDESCGVRLNLRGVSRRHAVITFRPGGVDPVIKDLGSSNGTFLNGERLRLEEQKPLNHGDLLLFSAYERTSFRFELPSCRIAAAEDTSTRLLAGASQPVDGLGSQMHHPPSAAFQNAGDRSVVTAYPSAEHIGPSRASMRTPSPSGRRRSAALTRAMDATPTGAFAHVPSIAGGLLSAGQFPGDSSHMENRFIANECKRVPPSEAQDAASVGASAAAVALLPAATRVVHDIESLCGQLQALSSMIDGDPHCFEKSVLPRQSLLPPTSSSGEERSRAAERLAQVADVAERVSCNQMNEALCSLTSSVSSRKTVSDGQVKRSESRADLSHLEHLHTECAELEREIAEERALRLQMNDTPARQSDSLSDELQHQLADFETLAPPREEGHEASDAEADIMESLTHWRDKVGSCDTLSQADSQAVLRLLLRAERSADELRRREAAKARQWASAAEEMSMLAEKAKAARAAAAKVRARRKRAAEVALRQKRHFWTELEGCVRERSEDALGLDSECERQREAADLVRQQLDAVGEEVAELGVAIDRAEEEVDGLEAKCRRNERRANLMERVSRSIEPLGVDDISLEHIISLESENERLQWMVYHAQNTFHRGDPNIKNNVSSPTSTTMPVPCESAYCPPMSDDTSTNVVRTSDPSGVDESCRPRSTWTPAAPASFSGIAEDAHDANIGEFMMPEEAAQLAADHSSEKLQDGLDEKVEPPGKCAPVARPGIEELQRRLSMPRDARRELERARSRGRSRSNSRDATRRPRNMGEQTFITEPPLRSSDDKNHEFGSSAGTPIFMDENPDDQHRSETAPGYDEGEASVAPDIDEQRLGLNEEVVASSSDQHAPAAVVRPSSPECEKEVRFDQAHIQHEIVSSDGVISETTQRWQHLGFPAYDAPNDCAANAFVPSDDLMCLRGSSYPHALQSNSAPSQHANACDGKPRICSDELPKVQRTDDETLLGLPRPITTQSRSVVCAQPRSVVVDFGSDDDAAHECVNQGSAVAVGERLPFELAMPPIPNAASFGLAPPDAADRAAAPSAVRHVTLDWDDD